MFTLVWHELSDTTVLVLLLQHKSCYSRTILGKKTAVGEGAFRAFWQKSFLTKTLRSRKAFRSQGYKVNVRCRLVVDVWIRFI